METHAEHIHSTKKNNNQLEMRAVNWGVVHLVVSEKTAAKSPPWPLIYNDNDNAVILSIAVAHTAANFLLAAISNQQSTKQK